MSATAESDESNGIRHSSKRRSLQKLSPISRCFVSPLLTSLCCVCIVVCSLLVPAVRPKSVIPQPPPTLADFPASDGGSSDSDHESLSSNLDSTFTTATLLSSPLRPRSHRQPSRPPSPSSSSSHSSDAPMGRPSKVAQLFRQQTKLVEQMMDMEEEHHTRTRKRVVYSSDQQQSELSEGEQAEGRQQRWKEERRHLRVKRKTRKQRYHSDAADTPSRINKPASAASPPAAAISYPYRLPPEFPRRKRRKRYEAQQVKLQLLPVRVTEHPPLEDDLIDSSSDEDDVDQPGQMDGGDQVLEVDVDEFDSVCRTPARYGRHKPCTPSRNRARVSFCSAISSFSPTASHLQHPEQPLSPVFHLSEPTDEQPNNAQHSTTDSYDSDQHATPHLPATPLRSTQQRQRHNHQAAKATVKAARQREEQQSEQDDIEEDTIKQEANGHSIDTAITTTAATLANAASTPVQSSPLGSGSSDRARLRTIVARARAMRPDVPVPLSSLFRLPLVAALTVAATSPSLQRGQHRRPVVTLQLLAPSPARPSSTLLGPDIENARVDEV